MKTESLPGERKGRPWAHAGMRRYSHRAVTGFQFLLASVLVGTTSLANATPSVDPPAYAPPAASTPIAGAEVQPTTLTERGDLRQTPTSSEWSVGGATGPMFGNPAWSAPVDWTSSVAWKLDIQRRRIDDGFVAGVTFEGTYAREVRAITPQLLGIDTFIGTTWRHRHWMLQGTIGAGIEAAEITDIVYLNAQGSAFGATTYHLGFYMQGNLTIAVPLTEAFAATVGLGLHLTATHDENWFAATTIGVRFTLPQ